jgi:hypothetical protein
MKEICDCSSGNFSWMQSNNDLRRHKWAIMQRRVQGVDAASFTRYSFVSGRSGEWILLSCDPSTVDFKERLRSLMIWETKDAKVNGQIHFGDAAPEEVPWIMTLARSLETSSEMPDVDVTTKTDDEIMSLIRF